MVYTENVRLICGAGSDAIPIMPVASGDMVTGSQFVGPAFQVGGVLKEPDPRNSPGAQKERGEASGTERNFKRLNLNGGHQHNAGDG